MLEVIAYAGNMDNCVDAFHYRVKDSDLGEVLDDDKIEL
jgi:hypothetical protein